MMSSMEDWDLQAIVKGCSRRPITSTTTTTTKLLMEEYPNFYSFLSQELDEFSCVYPPPDQFFETMNDEFIEGFGSSINDNYPVLHPLIHPVPHHHDSNNIDSTASSIPDLFRDFKEQQPAEKLQQKKQIAPTKQKQSKKSRQNRVVKEVKSDSVCSDSWGWRKYGQKPIKGSPYPRSYYRCSSSKGCSARKQVERSLSDPDIFVVTYTAEHNHAEPTRRNALAGTTRKKFLATPENPRFDTILSPSNSTSVASIEEDQQPMEGVAEGEVLMDMPFDFSTEHLLTGLVDFLFG